MTQIIRIKTTEYDEDDNPCDWKWTVDYEADCELEYVEPEVVARAA